MSSLFSFLLGVQITVATAEQYAREIGAVYIETSAKEDTNVQKLFEQLSELPPHPSILPQFFSFLLGIFSILAIM